MRTCIKAWMSLNLGQIPPLTMELAVLERLKNRSHHFFSVAIDPILFKLTGNEEVHYILDEFEFQPDRTTDYGISCPWASEKSVHPIIVSYDPQTLQAKFAMKGRMSCIYIFLKSRLPSSKNRLLWLPKLAPWVQDTSSTGLHHWALHLLKYNIHVDTCTRI